jgi:hypothetical protein
MIVQLHYFITILFVILFVLSTLKRLEHIIIDRENEDNITLLKVYEKSLFARLDSSIRFHLSLRKPV